MNRKTKKPTDIRNVRNLKIVKLQIEYRIGKASKFSKADINSFKRIVIDAGEVSENTFDGLLKKDPILLFIPNTEDIKAVGALKVPNDSYKEKVFTNSRSTEKWDNFAFELGWIVSLNSGNGKKLVEVLSKMSNNIYATVRAENNSMKHILRKYGFEKSGKSYKSVRDDYDIELYIKKENSAP